MTRVLAATALAATALAACQLLAGIDVLTYDENTGGQGGDGASDDARRTDGADGDEDAGFIGAIATIATGDRSACLLSKKGKVWCWGSADDGRLGLSPVEDATCDALDDGGLGTRCRTHPTEAVPLAGVATHVSAGRHFACARLDDGSVWCWGKNDLLELGSHQGTSSAVPVRVPNLPSALDVVAGPSAACARVQGAVVDVWCWGYDGNGALGRSLLDAPGGTLPPPAREPNRVLELPASTLSVHFSRFDTACARTTAGTYCWGFNGYGMLGRTADAGGDKVCPYATSFRCNARPQRVDFDVPDIAFASSSFCSIGTRPFSCWGSDRWGLLGRGTVDDDAHPGLVVAAEIERFSERAFRTIASTLGHACGVTSEGRVGCWGTNARGELSRLSTGIRGGDGVTSQPDGVWVDADGVAGGLPPFASVFPGVHYTLAVGVDGSLWGWGSNSDGILGHAPGEEGDRACSGTDTLDVRGSRCNAVPHRIPLF